MKKLKIALGAFTLTALTTGVLMGGILANNNSSVVTKTPIKNDNSSFARITFRLSDEDVSRGIKLEGKKIIELAVGDPFSMAEKPRLSDGYRLDHWHDDTNDRDCVQPCLSCCSVLLYII